MIRKLSEIIRQSDVSRETALGIVFRPDEKTLLLLRRNKPQVWSPPGGHIELDETAEAAAFRETYEETHIKGKVLGKIDVGLGPRFQAFVLAAPQDNKILLTGEHSGFYWFDVDNLSPSRGISPKPHIFKTALAIYRSKK